MFVEEMKDYLEQYYEAAGFADFYEQVLKYLSALITAGTRKMHSVSATAQNQL